MRKKKRPNTQQAILDLLRDNEGLALDTKQINMKVKVNYEYLTRQLAILHDEGMLYRRPGPGHSYLYSISRISKRLDKKVTLYEDREIPRIDVHAASLRSLLATWSEQRWDPKIYKSAQYLPLSLARLFELIAECMYGGEVTKEDLANVRRDLDTFKNDLFATCTTLLSILECKRIWDTKTFVGFLMSEDPPPVDLIREQAHKIREQYK